MRIAIVGAGVAGLAAAIGLQRAGASVSVFERAHEPTAEGSALTLFGNGFSALDALGVGDQVRAASALTAAGGDYRGVDSGGADSRGADSGDADSVGSVPAGQRLPDGRWLNRTTARMVGEFGVIHRVALNRILAEATAPGTIHYTAPVGRLWFDADGARLEGAPGPFDLVVGADGVRSTVRAAVGLDTGLRYAGYSAWRGVTAEPVPVDGAGETWGRGQRFGIAPLADGRVYWFATASMPRDAVYLDEMAEVRRRFATWHAPIGRLMDATPPSEVYRRDILELATPLRSFVAARTVLIGDAAHAMTPNLGQGGGLGLEDAAVLAACIGDYIDGERDVELSVLDDDEVLQVNLTRYDSLRRRRTQSIARQARLLGQVGQWRSPLFAGARDLGIRLVPTAVGAAAFRPITGWRAPS